MTNDSTAPATNGDVAAMIRDSENRVVDQLKQYMDAKQAETHRYFNTMTDQLTHDYVGVFNDRTEQHSDRLDRCDLRLNRLEDALQLP